jgi:hypothetical protein
VSERKWFYTNQYDKLLAPFPAVKCFEVSAVRELASMLAEHAQEKNALADSLAFLPAPATWLEYRREGEGVIEGYLLVQKTETSASCVSVCLADVGPGLAFIPMPLADLPLLGMSDADTWALDSTLSQQTLGSDERVAGRAHWDASKVDWDRLLVDEQKRAYWLYAALSIINSPKIVEQASHKPSSGLQKRLGRKAGKPFELLPWHEIFLDVRPPTDREGRGGDGERLTGPKAYHFCRSFIRIRLGKLERVRSHWRGDPTLGVSQASYKVMH